MTPRQRGSSRYTVSLIVSLQHGTRATGHAQLYEEEVVGVRVLTTRYPFLALPLYHQVSTWLTRRARATLNPQLAIDPLRDLASDRVNEGILSLCRSISWESEAVGSDVTVNA